MSVVLVLRHQEAWYVYHFMQMTDLSTSGIKVVKQIKAVIKCSFFHLRKLC